MSVTSPSTQNQVLCAVLFLCRYVLKREIENLGEVISAREDKRLPVVLTREEVKAVLSGLQGQIWIMAGLIYGARPRVSECPRLRVQDIDFGVNQITVRDGKGSKDRVTMLPQAVNSGFLNIWTGEDHPRQRH